MVAQQIEAKDVQVRDIIWHHSLHKEYDWRVVRVDNHPAMHGTRKITVLRMGPGGPLASRLPETFIVVDDSEPITLTESAASSAKASAKFKEIVGDSEDAKWQTHAERGMGL